MEQKTYSSQELTAIIGYIDKSGSNNSKQQVLTRCCNAGLKIEALDTPRGVANKYIIIEDNFHLDGEQWIDCYCNDEWEVSSLGRIRRKNTKKLMGSVDSTTGYLRVSMVDKSTGKQSNKMVHRMIYFSFHPELIDNAEHLQIDHQNGVRTDNSLSNLSALGNILNIKNRDENQEKVRLITTELIIKYGYDAVEKKLQDLLTNGL